MRAGLQPLDSPQRSGQHLLHSLQVLPLHQAAWTIEIGIQGPALYHAGK